MECGICLDSFKKKQLNKCPRCEFYICDKCFTKLIRINTYGCCPDENCIKNYIGRLFFNIKCPSCRINRNFIINNKTIKKYKIKLVDLIDKLDDYNKEMDNIMVGFIENLEEEYS